MIVAGAGRARCHTRACQRDRGHHRWHVTRMERWENFRRDLFQDERVEPRWNFGAAREKFRVTFQLGSAL